MKGQQRRKKLAALWLQMQQEDPYSTGYGRRKRAALALGVTPKTVRLDLLELQAAAKGR